jgi:Asp-tRNA(Asn)/Glu-tRNA(Gln) amidotransferase A subunit family amidase
MTALHWLSIAEIGESYRAGTLSPRAYVEHLIARVKAHDAKLGAFLKLDETAALRDADRAGDELAAGRDRGTDARHSRRHQGHRRHRRRRHHRA